MWNKELPYAETMGILSGLARDHVEGSGRHRKSLSECLDSLERGDPRPVIDYELAYHVNDSPDHLYNARQALAFFQKLEPLVLEGVDKEAVAYAKFKDSEEACRSTNVIWRGLRGGYYNTPPMIASILHGAIRKINRVLGDVPKLAQLKLEFGPGANTTVAARASSPRFKLGAKLACSVELVSSVGLLLEEVPGWVDVHPNQYREATDPLYEVKTVEVEISHGRLQFVPKNAKTYRSIVVEPILNSMAQKGIGTFLRGRLRSIAGIDLTDQSRNQNLAFIGSVEDNLATIDLSNASDTISKEVVASLVGPDWFSFLSRFRTGTVTYKGGEPISLEKFSSMGNAFTFELESLIFWALARSTCDTLLKDGGEVSVFGDDIIVPSGIAPALSEVLRFCGFTLNETKSFTKGPFRESCGADWFLGFDIRPYYQKSLVSPMSLFTLHNYYMRHFEFEMARKVVELIPEHLRIFGPDGYGDGHLIGEFRPRTLKGHERRGYAGVVFDTFTLKKRRFLGILPGDSALPGYSIYVSDGHMDDPTDHHVVRGSSGFKRISIYTLSCGIFRRF